MSNIFLPSPEFITRLKLETEKKFCYFQIEEFKGDYLFILTISDYLNPRDGAGEYIVNRVQAFTALSTNYNSTIFDFRTPSSYNIWTFSFFKDVFPCMDKKAKEDLIESLENFHSGFSSTLENLFFNNFFSILSKYNETANW